MATNCGTMKKFKSWHIIGLLVLILTTLAITADQYVQRKIRAHTDKISGLHIEKIDSSIFSNRISFEGITYQSNSLGRSNISCKNLQIKGIDRLAFIKRRDFSAKSVVFQGTDLSIDMNEWYTDSSISFSNYLGVDDLIVRDGNIKLSKGENEIASVEDVHLRMHEVQMNGSDSFAVNDYFIRTGQILSKIPNTAHQIEITSSVYDPDDEQLTLNTCKYFTTVSKEKWYEQIKKKSTRFDWLIHKINIKKPDIIEYFNNRKSGHSKSRH